MTTAGNRIIEGAKEALAIAKGEQPAARIWHQGHAYVPEAADKPTPLTAEQSAQFERAHDEAFGAPNVLAAPKPALSDAHAPNKFRKKPVVVEAHRVGDPWPDTFWQDVTNDRIILHLGNLNGVTTGVVEIVTLEGVMRADVGDWIIRGVKGELYPCKPDIFAATYEPASLATIPAAEARAVKPLGWFLRRKEWIGHSPACEQVYAVQPAGKEMKEWHVSYGPPSDNRYVARKATLDEAKAAAQADYEQRIRSALVDPQPAREPDDRDAEIERMWVLVKTLEQEIDCHDEEDAGWERDFAQERKHREAAEALAAKREEALREGLEILVNLIENVQRHGNYSQESTVVFIDQAAACIRAALRTGEQP
jgi:hypothetical protein